MSMRPYTASKPDLSGVRRWHKRFSSGAAQWRLTKDGLEIKGDGYPRTSGRPVTVRFIWEKYKAEILLASEQTGVPVELIIATAATESKGKWNALRKEPGYISDIRTPHRISPGIMQTLISTARGTLRWASIDRDWLFTPGNSFLAGSSYMAQQAYNTKFDPPVVACAYNSGGVYEQKGIKNRWRMRQYPIGTGVHADRFVMWFNDAVAVLAESGVVPNVSFAKWLGVPGVVPVPEPVDPVKPVDTPVTTPTSSTAQKIGIGGLAAIITAILAALGWIFFGR